ncbi:hypothetical protein S4054249_24355 [Pseudoalteromonas luteoviolacea]|uniref:Lysozyme inhibitor LprI N-terminal domain-containing protein n=1 Tax=Pseudoalteromonas luteoviolacea S4054 TaxID=1129367 RepID=A0A0F6A6P7_9GAMM|nr:hypothetical protein S4054249_24355 [Pseudoalteromonas luteoviolacea]AOT15862.1 hypothetical protein S40542_24155 [Pseudoalteromonas luteoviolacea]AOT20795.1 hypothetical protein S4054_24275 [Pseudoalteromonas luteoviolacea]KKE81872.1 hypothetical protein N479_20780 [Pseudoalteromonas luteoviolacea S4054]KZN72203.1 hypothetical protein N481_16075 [Pseudoalteromonas luteoviolacea S4047-1]
MLSFRNKIVTICLLFTSSYVKAHCNDLLKQQLSLLDTTLSEFDQTPNRGWRALSQQQCFSESALLIERYMEHNNQKTSGLMWHLFQMRAMAGQHQ